MATVPLSERIRLGLFGAFGGILPEVVALYQSRLDSGGFERYTTAHYLLLTIIYLGSAALVATIYPYKHRTSWRAMIVGITLPTMVGLGAGAAKAALPEQIVFDSRGNASPVGDMLSLIALF